MCIYLLLGSYMYVLAGWGFLNCKIVLDGTAVTDLFFGSQLVKVSLNIFSELGVLQLDFYT